MNLFPDVLCGAQRSRLISLSNTVSSLLGLRRPGDPASIIHCWPWGAWFFLFFFSRLKCRSPAIRFKDDWDCSGGSRLKWEGLADGLQRRECMSWSQKMLFPIKWDGKEPSKAARTHQRCDQWRWWKTSKRKMTRHSLNGSPGTNPLVWLVALAHDK